MLLHIILSLWVVQCRFSMILSKMPKILNGDVQNFYFLLLSKDLRLFWNFFFKKIWILKNVDISILVRAKIFFFPKHVTSHIFILLCCVVHFCHQKWQKCHRFSTWVTIFFNLCAKSLIMDFGCDLRHNFGAQILT